MDGADGVVKRLPLYKAIWKDAWSISPFLSFMLLGVLFCSFGLVIFADVAVILLAFECGGFDRLFWVGLCMAMQGFMVWLLAKWLTEKVSRIDDYPESED